MNSAYQEYKNIELSTEVLSASNHRLIQLLFNKCVCLIESAKNGILVNDLNKKNVSIKKANEIVDYLRMCLNLEDINSKKLSESLDQLYGFVQMKLLSATLKNNSEELDQAHLVLMTIKSGWDEMKRD